MYISCYSEIQHSTACLSYQERLCHSKARSRKDMLIYNWFRWVTKLTWQEENWWSKFFLNCQREEQDNRDYFEANNKDHHYRRVTDMLGK
jgi:hypothetical protein